MPEGPEVTITAQYLLTKLKGRLMSNLEVVGGKYLRLDLKGKNHLTNTKYEIKNIDSKGKLLWFELVKYEFDKNDTENKNLYLVSHFGLTGEWSFYQEKSNRIKILITNKNNDKKYYLYYSDDRNFGQLFLTHNYSDVENKINKLAPDFLKTEFNNNTFYDWVKKFISKSKLRSKFTIFKLLTNQNKSNGIGSGIGNYLAPEILYHSKLSPFRTLESLSKDEIFNLSYSIKYIIKLSYYNNTTGYMTNFGQFTEIHRKGIDSGKYPNYHPEIKFNENDKFEFQVYRQKTDKLGNQVYRVKDDKTKRSIYWVPAIQK